MRVVVGIATFNKRNLDRTIESLSTQAHDIRIYNNETRDLNLTDNGKFYFLSDYKEPVYYFTCDDDLIYPPDYVSKTIQAIEKHKCIVSYHGRILRGLNRSYYREHTALQCTHGFMQTLELDVCGTGVTAFRTDYFNPTTLWASPDKRMSDLVFSLEAAKQDKKIMHIGHQSKWIRYIDQPKGTTIYEMESKNESRQIEIANEIWLLKHK
jgi:hypothetical protein